MTRQPVTITEQEFWNVVSSGKRPPETVQVNTYHDQLVVEWRVGGSPYAVRVYSSIFGPKGRGVSRDTGEDSIRIALVDTELNQGLGKATLTQRTVGWGERLKAKIKEIYLQGQKAAYLLDKAPKCSCGGTFTPRVVKKGPRKGEWFYGCAEFPLCRESRNING